MIRSPEIRSADWLNYVRDTMFGYRDGDVAEWLEQLVPSAAHAIVFQGQGEHA